MEQYDKRKQKELMQMLKDKQKQEKKLQKELKKRSKDKYTTNAMKMAKKTMLSDAMTIDSVEYEDFKRNLEKLNSTLK